MFSASVQLSQSVVLFTATSEVQIPLYAQLLCGMLLPRTALQ